MILRFQNLAIDEPNELPDFLAEFAEESNKAKISPPLVDVPVDVPKTAKMPQPEEMPELGGGVPFRRTETVLCLRQAFFPPKDPYGRVAIKPESNIKLQKILNLTEDSPNFYFGVSLPDEDSFFDAFAIAYNKISIGIATVASLRKMCSNYFDLLESLPPEKNWLSNQFSEADYDLHYACAVEISNQDTEITSFPARLYIEGVILANQCNVYIHVIDLDENAHLLIKPRKNLTDKFTITKISKIDPRFYEAENTIHLAKETIADESHFIPIFSGKKMEKVSADLLDPNEIIEGFLLDEEELVKVLEPFYSQSIPNETNFFNAINFIILQLERKDNLEFLKVYTSFRDLICWLLLETVEVSADHRENIRNTLENIIKNTREILKQLVSFIVEKPQCIWEVKDIVEISDQLQTYCNSYNILIATKDQDHDVEEPDAKRPKTYDVEVQQDSHVFKF